MDIYSLFFSWPTGGIWSNMIANVVWGLMFSLPVYLWGVRKLHRQAIKHHQEQTDQRDRHHKIQMEQINSIHKKIDSQRKKAS